MAPPNWEDQEVECHHSAKYHTHMSRQSTCTNDNVYPPPWDNPPMSDRFFFTAAADCCEFYFPKAQCFVINVCDGDGVPEELEPVEAATPKPVAVPTMQPTSKPTKSAGDIPTLHENDNCHPLKKWHADTRLGKNEAGCTNNDVYPPSWDNPPLNESMFFDDPDECCEFFFPGNANCDWVNVCASIALTSTSTTTTTISTTAVNLPQYTYSEDNPCYNRKWHVDSGRLSSSLDLSVCINDLLYPATWNNGMMDGITLFTTPEACCDKVITMNDGEGGCTITEAEECIVETESPTNDGGGDEACSSKWHPDEDFKGCTNSPSGTYPTSWDGTELASKYMHDTYASCCDAFFNSRECVKTDLCNDECSASKWHPSRDFKTCSNSNDYPFEWETVPTNKARYIHDTYEECCSSASFAGKPCPKEDICNPTTCDDQFWHPDTMFKKCTNSVDFPSEWTTDTYLYGDYEACCSSNFPGRACPKEDVCNPTTCEDQLWHPTTDWKKCSNSVDHPPEWTTDNYLHSSVDECCEAIFPGKSCPQEDVCNPTPCEEQLWHPTTDFKTCSNDLDYPDAWNEGTGYDTYMHKSSEDCCNAMFFGRHCPKKDVCAPETPCSEQYWHPTTDWKKCSNSLEFPSVWSTDNYLHSSVDSCCEAIFPEMPCPLEDVCLGGEGSTVHVPKEESSCQDQKWHPSTDFQSCTNSKNHPPSWSTPPGTVATREPTQPPTSKPSNAPGSSKPTTSTSLTSESPTLSPTYDTNPTTSPIVCATAKWHPGEDDTCSNSPHYNSLWDMPALSRTYLHSTHAACCRVFYKKKNCGKIDVCAESTTAKPSHAPTSQGVADDTNICKMKKYHPMSVFTRKCINDDNFPPLWSSMTSTYFFSDAQDCCDSFYDDGWGACEVEDICSSPGRIPDNVKDCGKRWHPISEAHRICSNGDRYPPLWDSEPDRFLFSTAEECCEAFYSEGTGQCEIVNTC
eukprot:scaffold26497_cov61-Cyclotella_meneghiniana.AAC.2